ncbi:MAG: hypothetical protein N3G21_06755 [Candidatus Hydrogenedentes bacterium]|nr:hypothetical protein [Candidatus Hydrogenedentota bacterium]
MKFIGRTNSICVKWYGEVLLILLMVVLSFVVSLSHLYYRVNIIGKEYRFEQEWLVPAISLACGQGFTTPSAPYPENMSLFLQQKINSMSTDDLPSDWGRWDNSNFVKTHRYLISSIGLFWSIFGIRWDLLKVYASIMFTMTVIATYLGIRVFYGKLPAFIGAILTANSPALLFLLPSLRDYSKAVFFALFLAILAYQLKYSKSLNILGVLACLLGIVGGLGIGFRQDMLVLFLMGLVVIVVLSVWWGYSQKNWKYGLVCLVYVISFVISGFPILWAIRENNGAVSTHSIVQGLAYNVEERLLGGESSYRVVLDSNDMLVHSVILANARNKGFDKQIHNYLAPQYGTAGRLFFREIVKRFPADLWMRFLSASSNAFSVLYCFDIEQIANKKEFRKGGGLLFLSNYLIYWDRILAYLGPWALVWMVFLVGQKGVWKGLVFGAILISLLGYTSILFDFRHIVHLTPVLYAIPVVCVWNLVSGAVRFVMDIRSVRRDVIYRESTLKITKGFLCLIGVLAGITVIYLILVLWQNWMSSDVVDKLRCAKWNRVEVRKEIQKDKVLYRPQKQFFEEAFVKALPPMEVPFKFLRLDVLYAGGKAELISRYGEDYPAIDFSESFEGLIECVKEGFMGGENKLIRFYFPVFCTATIKPTGETIFENKIPIEWVRSKWLGVEIGRNSFCKVLGLYEIGEDSKVPLIFTVAVPENGGSIKPKRWRWGWNPSDVSHNLQENTGMFTQALSEFLGKAHE